VVHCVVLIIAALLLPLRIHSQNLSVQLTAPETFQRPELATLDVQRVEIKTTGQDVLTAEEPAGGGLGDGDVVGQIGELVGSSSQAAFNNGPGPMRVDLNSFGEQMAPRENLLTSIGGGAGGMALSGRAAGERGKMVAIYGGTVNSEEAVALALK